MRLLVPKLLKYKLPVMVQKMFARASILLHNVGNKAEIALDEDIARIHIALGG